MRLVFLGDSRFIGTACAEAALQAGHEVTVLHSGKYPGTLAEAEYRVAELGKPEALAKTLRASDGDALVDTFAMTREAASSAIAAARQIVPRLVLLSSQDVYAQFGYLLGHRCETLEDSVDESSALTQPFPFRGIAAHAGGEDYDKKLVEACYRDASEDFDALTILRLPAVYGPRDTKRRFGWLVDAFDAGVTELGRGAGGTWRWTHGYIDDIAAAVIESASSLRGCSTLNLGDRETPTMSQWAERIAARMEHPLRWRETEEVPGEMRYLGPMPCDFVADTSRARAALPIRETPEQERLDAMIGWLRETRDV